MAVRTDAPAPYAPPTTIIEVIDRYRERGLQTPFDKEVLGRAGVSDSLVNRTLTALETLDFIDEEGNPTQVLEGLAKAPGDQFKPLLADAIKAAYADVFNFTNPAEDTQEAVRDAFRVYEPRGQQGRMVTLFLGLCEHAGIISEHPEKKQARRSAPNAGTKKTETKPPRRKRYDVDFTKVNAAKTTDTVVNPAIAGLIQTIPASWTVAEREAFLATFRAVIEYAVPVKDDGASFDATMELAE